ncbi:MAG TPA: M90 family metallopeptidase [Longimicrobium sp.]|nr:M90 family metallopeptidase [Longimicrobium sp.]
MRPWLPLIFVAVLLVSGVLLARSRKRARREEVREQSFPSAWRDILLRTFPLYARLPGADQDRLHGLVQVFLAEKNVEGCGGLELTDEIRVTVAAQACVLLLHLQDANYFAGLRSILVYPSTVVPVYARSHEHGVVAEEVEPVLGQSWGHGTVILAWDSVKRGSVVPNDGRNVTFHEFAHQLDQEDGEADGTPYLDTPTDLRAWSAVMGEHYTSLRKAARDGRKTFLDDYGATNPAEFFAVATEFFFEKPLQLQKKHPALYGELAEYYGQDPASWPAKP